MPVSHSHQFLWVSVSPSTTVLTNRGWLGSVTSQTSWLETAGASQKEGLPSDVASPDHLGFARVSRMFSISGNVEQGCGVAGVCGVYDQGAISLSDSGEGIEGGFPLEFLHRRSSVGPVDG